MFATKSRNHLSAEGASQLVSLLESALTAPSLEQLAERVLPGVADMMLSRSVFLYVADARLAAPCIFQHGTPLKSMSQMKSLCAEQLDRVSIRAEVQVPAPSAWSSSVDLALYPLRSAEECVGLIGLAVEEETSPASLDPVGRLSRSLATIIGQLAERVKSERMLSHLNTYLTVSSMLAQSMDLHELLEIALYCCMEAVSAEAASVLLLDDEKRNFNFYQVEGPAKPVLMAASFPADEGIAGSVLQTQQSEIIADARSDSRFYKVIDSESDFQTRNMIALPLVAGAEEVGVLEVLNKAGGDSFTEEERLLLVSISEEVAFAIRNAKVFEYVVNTYCKQRQGQNSCRGCKRPLGSWTPCVKYRGADI